MLKLHVEGFGNVDAAGGTTIVATFTAATVKLLILFEFVLKRVLLPA